MLEGLVAPERVAHLLDCDDCEISDGWDGVEIEWCQASGWAYTYRPAPPSDGPLGAVSRVLEATYRPALREQLEFGVSLLGTGTNRSDEVEDRVVTFLMKRFPEEETE